MLKTTAYIGKNGLTYNKQEKDGKTPKGNFELGIAFGIYKKAITKLDNSIKYIQINENLYWVDDSNSIYYNQLVDITKVKRDWNSAEHLSDYIQQYEYAIEIKSNPQNIPNKRKCNFFAL